MADDTEDQGKEPDTDAAGNEPNQPTGDSGQKPPWERDGEEFSPEKAWNLIRNLRADNAKLKESDDAKAVKLREIEDANLSEKEKADRDLKEAREQLDAIRTQKAWAEAMAEHQCLTKEDFDLIGAGSPQEVREKAASKHKRPSTPMHGAEGRFCISASEAGLELVDRHLERVRHSSGRAERHEPRVAHAPDPLVDPLSGKSGGARDLRLPHPPFIQHIRERHPFRLPARYPSVPAHSASTPAGIECPDNPAANAPSAMTSEHNPSLSFMMSHAIGWEPGLPDSWDIRKALSSPPAPPPWRPARFGLPVEGNHHRGYGCYDRPEPGEKFARRLQQLRDLLHVHLLSLPTPPL